MTREEAMDGNVLLNEWQTRLGLYDWRIKLRDSVGEDEMQGAVGNADYQESTKTAIISILDEKDYGDRVVPFDYEQTLIHELLHLKLSLVSDVGNDFQARYMHQIIDDLARAFVDTKKTARKEIDFLRKQVERCAEIMATKVGKWERSEIKSEEWVCSKCGGQAWMFDYKGVVRKSRHCPNCGALMEKESNESSNNKSVGQ